MPLDNQYSFFLNTLPAEEITKDLLIGYPWRYTVSFIDASEDLEEPVMESASYYGTTCDLFDQVVERWEYDFKYTHSELLEITLTTPGMYVC